MKTEINENELTLVVSKQELGVLETNALAIKEKIEKLLPNYDAKNYDITNLDQAVKDRALLNKTSKALNDKRITLEKEFNKPFENFKAIIKETTDLIKSASAKIDEVVKEVENKDKEDKKKAILVIFESEVSELKNVLPFERIFDERWLNKTFDIKDVESDLKTKLEQIRADLLTISELHSKYEVELKNDYLMHFDLGLIIRKNSDLIQKEELLKNQKEESEKVIEEKKEEKMIEMATTKVEEKIIDPIMTYTLKITGKKSQLVALKTFLNTNEMQFEKVE